MSSKGRPSTFIPLNEQKRLKEERIRLLRQKKKQRSQMEKQRKIQELIEIEQNRTRDLANQRWRDCLSCLKDSVGKLTSNPWLIIHEPIFIHDYLDSLTETLANLSKHEEDIDEVRAVLQDVYEGFVDVGRFAKYQPAFYISNAATIKRFVRLLEQVAHRGSDKALFPNVLSLLGPTFEREELYDFLADVRIVHSLMSFVRTDWMPTPSTLALLLSIIEQLSCSVRLRQMFMADTGFEKLQGLAYGFLEGFTKEQQMQAQQALALFPPPKREEAPASPSGQAADAEQSAGPIPEVNIASPANPAAATPSARNNGGADDDSMKDKQLDDSMNDDMTNAM